MTRARKVWLALGLAAAMVVAGWGALFAAVWMTGGVITVRIEDRGEGLALTAPVPVAALDAAVAVGRLALDRHERGELEAALHGPARELAPALSAMLEELAHLPDATLVEVEEGASRVWVRVSGGALVVEVREPDLEVEISVPAAALSRTLSRLLA